jgi:hypothetical protein
MYHMMGLVVDSTHSNLLVVINSVAVVMFYF